VVTIFSTPFLVLSIDGEGFELSAIRSLATGKTARGTLARRLAIALFGCGLATAATAAEQSSGNYWKALCDLPENDYACAYYINGLVDGLMMGVTETSLVSRGTASKVYGYCPPSTTSVGDMKQVFRKYLDEHPKERQYRGASLALEAWRREWPCPK
jgi:hypothetical protein